MNLNSLFFSANIQTQSCDLGGLFCFVCLFGFLTSSSTPRLYRGRAPRQSVRQFYVLPHMRQSWETMTSVSAGHIILTPTQPVGSERPQWESNPGPPHQESHALPTELPHPPIWEVSRFLVSPVELIRLSQQRVERFSYSLPVGRQSRHCKC